MSEELDSISIINSLQYNPPKPSNTFYQEGSLLSQILKQLDPDYLYLSEIKNPPQLQKDLDSSVKEEHDPEDFVKYNTLTNIASQSESNDINQDFQQKQQPMEIEDKQAKIQKAQKFNQYYLGHIDYLISCPWPIYGCSRKYQRSKKGRGSKKLTELEAIAKRMKSFKGKRLDTGYPKRFDQQLNKKFRKLAVNLQEQMDITPSALRNIIKNKGNGDNSQILNQLIEKCEAQRHWSDFLSSWENQKQVTCEEDLNC